MPRFWQRFQLVVVLLILALSAYAQGANPRLVPISEGWAKNSVNAVIFRRNSIVSHEGTQYVAFYDADARVTLAKRQLSSTDWEVANTKYRGKATDAHNSISLMVDGEGYLHVSWDHHGDPLRYCKGVAPGSLELTDKLSMTGEQESKVTYPEFYRLPNGDLLFFYRDGGSGRGNLLMNHYDTVSKRWTQRQPLLIDGEGERNAYWQVCTDDLGTVHLSWVWRDTGNIATNHDLGYARSLDEGHTWQTSAGAPQAMPITIANADYAARIRTKRELMNTTSMCADSAGRPYLVNYWRPEGSDVPQYHVVYHDGEKWNTQQITRRTTPFTFSGNGTKAIPISRPQIVADNRGETSKAYMLFRDVERGRRVSLAICDDLQKNAWRIEDLTDFSVGMWEPSYDTELWRHKKQLHVYAQNVGQGDGEKTEAIAPQMVNVLEWTPE